jgi:CBS-domain-containing membrane protein
MRVYSMFTTLALRHLTVTDAGNRVLGIVTRKDVMAAVDRSH